MIRRLFRRKISKFGEVVSLALLSAMLVVFFLFMPEFALSTAGRVFIGVWTLLAVLSFVAYGSSVRARRGRQYIPLWGIKKVGRSTRARPTSWVRGL